MGSKALSNKTAIITGGAGGLGKAIAEAFLEAGANVVVCDVNKALLEKTTAELSAKGPFHTVVTDVSSEESTAAMVNEAIKKFGQVDILVNNAGIMDRLDPAGELDKRLWDRVIAVNLTGPYILTKLAVNHFLERSRSTGDRGVILNIGSLATVKGAAAGFAYTASKHGLLGITKNTAAFYAADGIRCNILLPGGMSTNIGDAFVNGKNEKGWAILEKIMAQGATASDMAKIANTAVFICSEQGNVINGASIAVDDGWQAV